MPKRLILASASPRRRELLSLLRLPFEVIVSEVDEDLHLRTPARTACVLAERKAEAVGRQLIGEPCLIIGADTIVAVDAGEAWISLTKPRNDDDARRMLKALSGRTHTVCTGVAFTRVGGQDDREVLTTTSRAVDTQVTFRELTDEMIDAYIATGEPFDKAGGYGIQGYASTFVEAIYGDYFNIVGLPVATVAKTLEEIGIEWWKGPQANE